MELVEATVVVETTVVVEEVRVLAVKSKTLLTVTGRNGSKLI
jgi:hypothetical protein